MDEKNWSRDLFKVWYLFERIHKYNKRLFDTDNLIVHIKKISEFIDEFVVRCSFFSSPNFDNPYLQAEQFAYRWMHLAPIIRLKILFYFISFYFISFCAWFWYLICFFAKNSWMKNYNGRNYIKLFSLRVFETMNWIWLILNAQF